MALPGSREEQDKTRQHLEAVTEAFKQQQSDEETAKTETQKFCHGPLKDLYNACLEDLSQNLFPAFKRSDFYALFRKDMRDASGLVPENVV
jgi:hypothetical protein